MNLLKFHFLLTLLDMNLLYSFHFKALVARTTNSLLFKTPKKNSRILFSLYSTADTDITSNNDNKKVKIQNNSRRKKPSNSTTSSSGDSKEDVPGPTQEEIRQVRINKMTALKSLGIEPFAYSYDSTHKSTGLLLKYDALANGEEDTSGDVVSIAGRIMIRRVFGKLAFYTIQDDVGEIQTYIEKGYVFCFGHF